MIQVLVNGAHGRMGQEVVKAIENDTALQLAGTADKDDNLAAAIQSTKAQVVVDFTLASVGFDHANAIIDAGAHPVIGTTGFLPEHIETLQKRCAEKKLGGIIAPNFCIGVVLMMQYAKAAARYFPNAEIIELHHDGKEESPSGTAIRTAEMINEGREHAPNQHKDKAVIKGARGATHQDVHIHSIRLPGLLAHQEVIFGNTGETLTIRQDTLHRESFMPGVCLACKKVTGLDELVYGLEHIL